MNKKIRMIACLMASILMVSGCKLLNPYVGRTVDTKSWYKYENNMSYTDLSDAVTIKFSISESNEPGEYNLEGTLDGSKGSLKSIDHLVTQDSNFFLLLAKDNVIVECVAFIPRGLDHTHKLPFKRSFKSEQFDSISIGYTMSVRG